ncbi:RNA polymerase sigma-70 factor, ECF subfamily [Chitinophaga jiangningensis]|uniref:RNA polymerase sigma-70 factor, ECF subfamily n=1 Tax=Chitinophaga jiangningensis TaxID=1419482 RepID=A0A1M7F947_9BACT|nr:RNA polymerase sigma-70 factor [Chitinophaga jiangningensis]SHM00485.1 RNA polymerase sigma-70 factor, ECF subfamily [Chitinophaga jiangningensis]
MSDAGQPNSETTWMQRLRDNDTTAFTEIYETYRDKLLAVAYNRLCDLQAAEDVVQDVFASLWHQRHNSQIENAGAYLATAVKYKVLDRFRREQLLRQYQQVYQADIVVNPATPESALQYKHIMQLYQEEVNRLPEKCQLIFRYSREQGMPVKEIAAALNISHKTVENQLTKALRHLKGNIKNYFSIFF